MAAQVSAPRWTTYTMGYQGMDTKTFLTALQKFKIRTVLDVRACPNSNKAPDWKLAKLKALCMDNGVDYKWKGQKFGGIHQKEQLLNKLNDKDRGSMFLRSTFNLIEHPAAIMCTESNIVDCCRKYIVDALIVHNLSACKHITFDQSQPDDGLSAVDYSRPKDSKIQLPDDIEEKKADDIDGKEADLPTDLVVKNVEITISEKFPTEMSKSDFDGFKNSLCIIPPNTVWPRIQDIRRKHDAAYKRWPPHFNVLYPFVAEKYYPSQVKFIEKALREIKPFRVVLKEFKYFDKAPTAKDADPTCYVFLSPTSDALKQFQRIYDALSKLYPCCAAKKHKQGFKAHLTVGQFPRSQCQEWVDTMNAEWQPISYLCDYVALIARTGGDDPFQVRARVQLKLGGATPMI